MASQTPPPPVEQQTPVETTKKSEEQQTQVQTTKKPEDPKDTIENILEIVNKLHKKVKPQDVKPQDESVIKRSRSGGDEVAGHEATPAPTDPNKPLETSTSLPNPPKNKSAEQEDHHISKLERNLRLLREDVVKLQDLRGEVADEVWNHMRPLKGLLDKVEEKSSKTVLTKGMKKDLDDINKKIFNLMCQVPLLPNKRKKKNGLDSEDVEEENNGRGIVCLPGIHARDEYLKTRAIYRYVVEEFLNLDSDVKKISLLSFAMFPENQEVNRTMLMYWWLGEGILTVQSSGKSNDKEKLEDVKKKDPKVQPPGESNDVTAKEKKPEDVVKEILKDFIDRKLIEPVENKRKVEPNSYKMTPFVHSSVVLISKEIGLFNMYPNRKDPEDKDRKMKPSMKKSKLKKVCLVEGSSSQAEAKAKKMPAGEIETVFNVSERFPDFAFKWFSEEQPGKKRYGPLSKTKYKDLRVFYLGRWERTAKRHIEVENPELMKYLKPMTKLKLLSFQGISRIEKLDDAVCKLRELIILDLRACYNLEKLPEKIDSLKALIYLDITDCYMIDRMPKRLSWLDNLEVLKGFVVSDADPETVCTLDELKHLKKLRKLTITINTQYYSVRDLFLDIKGFENLEKLKVAWGGMNQRPQDNVKDGENQKGKKNTDGGKKQDNKNEDIDGGKKQDNKNQGIAEENNEANPDTKKLGLLQRAKTMIGFGEKKDSKKPGIPKTLKKLDLQCFPKQDDESYGPYLPEWLHPHNLGGLEKLYIKGGIELTGFEKELPTVPTDCKVKVLRLKFLPKLKVEWRDLRKIYFPQLEYLEKYQCPQVSFCPCDGIGIWRSKPE